MEGVDPGLDLLQGVQDAASENGPPPVDMGDFKMPSMEQIMEMINSMDLPEEEKLKLLDGMNGMDQINPRAQMFQEPIDNLGPNYTLVFVAVLIITSIMAFTVYKLYKSLTDRELKREVKRKQRMQKKHKKN